MRQDVLPNVFWSSEWRMLLGSARLPTYFQSVLAMDTSRASLGSMKLAQKLCECQMVLPIVSQTTEQRVMFGSTKLP